MMSKRKYDLSSKQKILIDLLVNIPDPKELGEIALLEGVSIDRQATAFDSVCEALRILSKNTKSSEICNDLIERASILFERK